MSPKSIYAIATTETQVNGILLRFLNAGSYTNDISVLAPDRVFSHEGTTKAPGWAVMGAVTGGLAGGAIGLLAGIGALVIPGVGPLVAAGPLLSILAGLGAGAAAGRVAGGLIGMGSPELEARLYQNRIPEGKFLISVRTVNGDGAGRVRKILNDAGAEEISVASMNEAPLPRKQRKAGIGNELQSFQGILDV